MLNRTDKERLATLEAIVPRIEQTVNRIEKAQGEAHMRMDEHINYTKTNGTGNGGVTIVVGRKTIAALATTILGGFGAYLKTQGII